MNVEVHLADAARVVAGLLQGLEKRGEVGRHVVIVPIDTVVADVSFGEERCARRHAERPLTVGAAKSDTLGRQAVHVRGLHHRVAFAAHGIGPVLVGHNHKNVGPLAWHPGSFGNVSNEFFAMTQQVSSGMR